MDRSLTSTVTKFFTFISLVILLSGCDIFSNNNCHDCDDASLHIEVDFLKAKQQTKSRSLNGNITDIESLEFNVFNKSNKKIRKKKISRNGVLDIKVPAGQQLTLSVDAFIGSKRKFRGTTAIPPLKPGQSHSASFMLEGLDDTFDQPIQLDIGINNKPGNAPSTGTQFSQDLLSGDLQGARFVLFKSKASNLVPHDYNEIEDLFVKDLATNTILNVHTNSKGVHAIAGKTPASLEADISLDGKFVVFASTAPNLFMDDTNESSDVFLKNLHTGFTMRINHAMAFDDLGGADFPSISDDGQFVAFYSAHQLADNAGAGVYLYNRLDKSLNFLVGNATKPVISGNGSSVVFVRESDGGLSVYDIVNNKVTQVTSDHGSNVSFLYSINKQGSFVAYSPTVSYGSILAGHSYLFDIENEKNFIVSTNQDGTSLGSNESELSVPVISNDGRYVAFSFNGFVYVKAVSDSGSISAIEKGTKPFISGSGQLVGYSQTDTGNIWFRGNPIFEDTSLVTPLAAPSAPTLSVDGENIVLQWEEDASASYYRIYLSNKTPSDHQSFNNSDFEVIDTRDTQFDFGTSLTINRDYYFLITAISPQGESPISEPLHIFYEGVKPVVNNTTVFYSPAKTQVSGQAVARDPFDKSISFTLVSSPTRGTVTFNNDGTFTYSYTSVSSNDLAVGNYSDPAPGGFDSFVFRASNGEFETDGWVFIDFNDKPIIVPNYFVASSNNTYSSRLMGKDPDQNQRIQYELVSDNTGGSVVLKSDGSFSYTPGPQPPESVFFTYRTHDNFAYSDEGQAEIYHAVSESCLNSRSIILSNAFTLSDNNSLVSVSGGLYGEVAGFMLERGASGEPDAGAVVSSFEGILNLSSSYTRISQKFGVNRQHLINEYVLTVSTPQEALALSNALSQNLGVNIDPNLLPIPSQSTPEDSEFRLALSVLYQNESSVVIAAAIVASTAYADNEDVLRGFIDSGNISFCGNSIRPQTDHFTAQDSSTNIADFLFVIDNSGSMGNEQLAVESAAIAFSDAMVNAGLDFHIGIITTDSQDLRGGGFITDISTFQQEVVMGTGGSARETGIWFSEQSLQSINFGNTSDGSVTAAGYPRAGATLSVIIMSDEPSQYTRRSPNGVAFDPTSNLFIERGYRVYAIVDEGHNSSSQYDDLALNTGGSTASILNTSVFPTIMQDIAINAGGFASNFKLSQRPISSTIVVTNNGFVVPRSSVDGWQFIPLTNSIVFYGDAIPTAGDNIDVEYIWIFEEEQPPLALHNGFESVNLSPVQGKLRAIDPNGDPIFGYNIVTPPSQGQLVVNGTDFTYTPANNAVGSDYFTFTATDNDGTSAPGVISINLKTNFPAVLTDFGLQACYSDSVTGSILIDNEQDDTLTYNLVSAPSNGSVTFDSSLSTLTYSPNDGTPGADTFTFTVFDGFGTSNEATVTVDNLGACPVATNGGFFAAIGQTTVSTVPVPTLLGNYTYGVYIDPNYGAISVDSSSGELLYTPSVSSSIVDDFYYEIYDDRGASFADTGLFDMILVTETPTIVHGFEPGVTYPSSNLLFGGNAGNWVADDTTAAEGSTSLVSPQINPGESTSVTLDVIVPPSSEETGFGFSLKTNNTNSNVLVEISSDAGSNWNTVAIVEGGWNWHPHVVTYPAGVYLVRFTMSNNGSTNMANIWIDDVKVTTPVISLGP